MAAKLAVVKTGLTDLGDDALGKPHGAAAAAVVTGIELFVHFPGFRGFIISWHYRWTSSAREAGIAPGKVLYSPNHDGL
jgi:hypothetical protein